MDNRLWKADLGDGTYKNPILNGDYSDPDAIRVGEDYYMISSSFCNAPGIPLLHSKDLVNWKVVNYVLDELPGEHHKEPTHGSGVWAPAIRYHDGMFYVCFPMAEEGIYMTTAKDPLGKWSEPVCICEEYGWIDPCPFWDDDGQAYLVVAVAKGFIGYNSVLYLRRMTPDGMSTYGEIVKIFDGNDNGQYTIEGPKLYKKNGFYYIFAPAGGVKPGWQTVLRSKNIWGPYEFKEVLKQGTTDINGPHQGAWVDTVTGEDWFVHFQDRFAIGRVVHLQPMIWTDDDWPVIGNPVEGEDYGEPVACYRKPDVGQYNERYNMDTVRAYREDSLDYYGMCAPDATDLFDKSRLGLQWQWNANPQKEWYTLAAERKQDVTKEEKIMDCVQENHGIYLHAVSHQPDKKVCNMSNLLLQKWPLRSFECVTKVDLSGLCEGDFAGIVSLATNYAAIVGKCTKCGYELRLLHGLRKEPEESDTVICKDIPATIYLKYTVIENGCAEKNRIKNAPCERICFSYSLDGEEYIKVHEMPSMQGFWVGVKNGIFAANKEHEQTGSARFVFVKYLVNN